MLEFIKEGILIVRFPELGSGSEPESESESVPESEPERISNQN